VAAEPSQLDVAPGQLSRIDWATLLRRVHAVDALKCPKCGGRLRFEEVTEDKSMARRELKLRGLACEPPPLRRSRFGP
jgi:hypothetical protein